MNVPMSISEDHGIAELSDRDLMVYSVGVSTAGFAEIRMAKENPRRSIIATTIDPKGVLHAQEFVKDENLTAQIQVKNEDVSELLPYEDGYFDYVYARLVLHYLSQQKLRGALSELYRVLKPGGRIFIVVRSDTCVDARRENTQFDPHTKLTTGGFVDSKTGNNYSYSRYFHTEESIQGHVSEAGFIVLRTESYEERLLGGFKRTEMSSQNDHLIELVAQKPL